MPNKPRHVALVERIRLLFPDLPDPEGAIATHRVVVDGVIVSNRKARVARTASIRVAPQPSLPRGAMKLAAALERFEVRVGGRVCLDVGASTGGFTAVLLRAGARRVYSVDAGHGQLLGSLRADERVVNLERTNVGSLDRRRVPEAVELVAVDLSYLALAAVAPQLEAVAFAQDADLVALVKPTFELRRAGPPQGDDDHAKAVEVAIAAFEATAWRRRGEMRSPVTGRRGAVEHLIHLRRAP